MKAIAISVVVILAAMKVASSQTSPPISTRTINLTVEQYHIIKENVLKNAQVESRPGLPPVKIVDHVPNEISLKTFPPDLSEKISSLSSHVFYIDKQRIVIVDPKDNSVADIIG
jgi:hypothetical protein